MTNYDKQAIDFLNLTCTATFNGKTLDFEFCPFTDCSDMEQLREMAFLEFQQCEDLEPLPEGIDQDLINLEISDFSDVPDKYANECDIWEFAESFANGSYSMEVFEAAINCDVNISDVDEAYQGEFSSDEDFARDMAENIGAIDKKAGWPNNCIDWEFAAKELMYDYCESDGHYFRNF